MFCSHCGQDIPEGSKFCPACGTPVEALEPEAFVQPEEMPDAETAAAVEEAPAAPDAAAEAPAGGVEEASVAAVPAQASGEAAAPILTGRKGGRSIVVIAVLAVVALALVFGLVKLLPAVFGGGGKEVYVYSTDDDELMLRRDLKAKSEATELSDESADSVYFSKDGKYIYFFEGDGGDSFADLYMIRTADAGKKNASSEKISSSVYTYDVTVLDGGGLLYLKGDSSDMDLFCYNGKESSRIARDVSSYDLDDAQKYAYYSEWDGDEQTLYRVELKKSDSKETLLKNVNYIYSDLAAEVLVYGMDNGDGTCDLYCQKPGGDKQKIASDVDSVFEASVSGGKADVLYTISDSEQVSLYDFVTDRLAESDAAAREPSSSDYQTYTQGFWGGYYTTDWDAYNRAMEQWYPVRNRNSIRETLKSESYSVDYYTLYRYSGGDTKKIAENLIELQHAMDEDIYLYRKYESEVETVADVADLDNAWEVYDRMGSSGGSAWYQNIGGSETAFTANDDYGNIGNLYVLSGSEVVLEAYGDYDYALLSYSVGKSGLSYKSEITDEYQSIYVLDGKLYYFTDVSRDGESGDLICYSNGSKTTLAKEAEGVSLLKDGAVFSVEDQSYNSRRNRSEYSLYSVGKDGKKIRVADDVSSHWIVDAKKVLYVSDGDLYVWNGKDSERLANDVRRVWASKRAEQNYFWCGY